MEKIYEETDDEEDDSEEDYDIHEEIKNPKDDDAYLNNHEKFLENELQKSRSDLEEFYEVYPDAKFSQSNKLALDVISNYEQMIMHLKYKIEILKDKEIKIILTKEQRNKEILKMWKDGKSHHAIGNIFGLTQPAVSKIIKTGGNKV